MKRAEGPPRAGFALLLGKPNVGKSTLLNRLVGERLAIVSDRPQTTRTRMLGMVHRPGTQLVLVDAPGVHKAKGLMNRAMVEAAMGAMSEVDVILYLAEAGWPTGTDATEEVDVVGAFHREILKAVQRANKPVVLVLTKIDLLAKTLLLPVMQGWSSAYDFKAIYPLCGLTGDNVEGLVDVLRPLLPESGPLFPEDQLTDQSERSLCAEFIREQLFLKTRQEIPYGTAVTVELFDESERPLPEDEPADLVTTLVADPEAMSAVASESEDDTDDGDDDIDGEDDLDTDDIDEDYELGADDIDVESLESDDDEDGDETDGDETEGVELDRTVDIAAVGDETDSDMESEAVPGPGLVRIEATIVLERESHKGIVIGKRGTMLREIGAAARARIERLLGCRVWLGLHVRVIPGWTERKAMLAELGLDGR